MLLKEYNNTIINNEYMNNTKSTIKYSRFLPESTKQKIYKVFEFTENKIENIFSFILLILTLFLFGGQLVICIYSLFLHILNYNYTFSSDYIVNLSIIILILVISLLLMYFVSYKLLWKKLYTSTKSLIKSFKKDRYEILKEGTIIYKYSSKNFNSTSCSVRINSGERYNVLFNSQYSLMNIGNEIYIVKVNGQIGAILK